MRVSWPIAAAVLGAALGTAHGGEVTSPAFVYTAAQVFAPASATRFPRGAAVVLARGSSRRRIAPGFYASADPAVSFDGNRILFAGKPTLSGPWQIWEASVNGGDPRQLVHSATDCTHPLYVPDGRIAYTRASAAGSDVVIAEAKGGSPRLTFGPGHHVTQDVLRDGRILFTSEGELYTVYPDGTGVESLRCDHGPRRSDARQLSSGDVVFSVGGRLARFTPALASQVDVAQPDGELSGPIAEVSPGNWIVSLRQANSRFGLYLWTQEGNQLRPLETSAEMEAVQPVVLASRVPAKEFPSALVPSRTTGNLLCLDARASGEPITEEAATVQICARGAAGVPMLLGRQKLAGDGSFYVEVPADRPLRIELLDSNGRTVRGEHGWFWMRPSEQRICVGCHTGPEQSPENKVPEILLRTIVPEKLLGAGK